jgi:hypothetical protein
MLSIDNPKIIMRFILVFVVLIFYDILWDLLLTLLHSLLMFLHFLFEFCEHALDVLIEHLFHTDPRTTEIIVFYMMAFAIGCIVFKLIKAVPDWCCKSCERLINYWHHEKKMALVKWQNQPLIEKFKWGSVFITSSVFMIVWALN